MLVNRVVVHGRAPESKEVTFEYAVTDTKTEDDTDFDSENPSVTQTLALKIPVHTNLLKRN